MLTDAVLKGINKAWGAGEEEETWEQTRDRIWAKAKSTPGLGSQFWAVVGLDPDMNPENLTREDVQRLNAELSGVAQLRQRTLENTFAEAKRLGINLREFGFEFDEYDPNTISVDPNSEEFLALHQNLRHLKDMQEGEAALPGALRQWKEEWQVPKSEWEGWADYPTTVKHPEHMGNRVGYYQSGQGVALTPHGAQSPSVIGHELAHANYFENMPPAMRAIYPWTHQLAQRINPQYKEAVERYSGKIPGTETSLGTLPTEGYATAYQHLGQQPEQMPWYKEPFYGNLMYPVPEGQDTTLRWLLNWAVDKYRKWQQEKKGTWSPPMPEEELKRLATAGWKDQDWSVHAAEQEKAKKKGGGGHHGGYHELL